MRPLHILSAAVLAASLSPAADDYPVLVYPCYRAGAAPVLDGRLDDPCWAAAPLAGGMIRHDKPQTAEAQTFFRVLADERALYVAVQCEEPLAARLVREAPSPQDDHAAVFRGEAVEIFVDPGHDHAAYYQIAFSLSGSLFDGKGTDPSWNSAARAATAIGPQSWTMEAAIPWADLGVRETRPGMVVGFNLCRDRNLADPREWTTWSRVDANFHDPAHFGHLVLFPTADLIAAASPALRLGDRQGPLQVFAPDGFAGATYSALVREALARLDEAVAELEAVCRQEPGGVAEVIRRRLAEAQGAAAPIRQKLDGVTALDAADWLRAERSLSRLTAELRGFLWQARLQALLESI